jgi:hypothetical protein
LDGNEQLTDQVVRCKFSLLMGHSEHFDVKEIEVEKTSIQPIREGLYMGCGGDDNFLRLVPLIYMRNEDRASVAAFFNGKVDGEWRFRSFQGSDNPNPQIDDSIFRTRLDQYLGTFRAN